VNQTIGFPLNNHYLETS